MAIASHGYDHVGVVRSEKPGAVCYVDIGWVRCNLSEEGGRQACASQILHRTADHLALGQSDVSDNQRSRCPFGLYEAR
jgi:hypothetical protein